MAGLPGADDDAKLKALSQLKYKEQAVWFLNAFWKSIGQENCEKIWAYCQKMVELDDRRGADGYELDEFLAHRFLEVWDETLTVRKMRTILKEIDLDTNKNVSLAEFLVFRYKVNWRVLVNSTQSDNEEEVAAAAKLVQEAQDALAKARNSAEEARKAEEAQKRAEAELKRALDQLHAEEEAFENKKKDLEKKSEEGGLVSRNRAKNELQQLLAEDPLPLRRAKINQGAAVRKAEKASKLAVESRLKAEGAVKDAEAAFKKAEDFLQEVKARGGSAEGGIWWMERELEEAKKYMPQRKGGRGGDAYWTKGDNGSSK